MMKKYTQYVSIGLAIVWVLCSSNVALGQGCSTCTATANSLDAESAENLNAGIIYLALTPLAFLATLAIIWYRRNYVSAKSADN